MTGISGPIPEKCPNSEICGKIPNLAPGKTIELYQVENRNGESIRKKLQLTKQDAANLLLMMRGCPQTVSSLGIPKSLTTITSQLEKLDKSLADYENRYIPPQGSEVHTYNVKRPSGVYSYNKLSAEQAVFESSEHIGKVKAIHLSHDRDPRNLEARAAIARRNRLQKLANRLEQISASLVAVLADYEL